MLQTIIGSFFPSKIKYAELILTCQSLLTEYAPRTEKMFDEKIHRRSHAFLHFVKSH